MNNSETKYNKKTEYNNETKWKKMKKNNGKMLGKSNNERKAEN
jgi:hypothetical protein